EPQLASLTSAGPLGERAQLVCVAAIALVWIGDWATAETLLRPIVVAARATGTPSVLPLALESFAEFELRRGRIAAAYATAAEALQLGDDTGLALMSGASLVTLARVEAVMGQEAACREHVAEALARNLRAGSPAIQGYGQAALGLLELGAGHPERALV